MNRGFSTLEMLIAMTVLTLAISATIMLFPGIQSGSVDSELNAEALSIAQKTLESEQALARKDFRLVVATTSTETSGSITFTKTVATTMTDFFTKKMTATVSWGGLYGRSQSVVLAGVVADFNNAVGGDTCDSSFPGNWSLPQSTSKALGSGVMSDSSGLYPITDLDAYRKRLYVTVNNTGTPPSVGPSTPISAASASGIGSVAWTNPTNGRTNDAAYATASLGAGQTTNYLKVTGFGFSLPADATVLGITVKVSRKGSSSTNTVKDAQIRIVKADGSIGSDTTQAHATSWPTTEAVDTYGSSSYLWGETDWSPAAINNANFGVAIAALANSGTNSRTASVNYVTVTVTYTKQLYILNASTPGNPTFAKSLGQNAIPTGLNAIAVATSTASGDYAYAATNSTVAHLEVIDVGATPAKVLSAYQIPSAAVTANTVFYKDGYAYVGLQNNPGGPEFIVVDVHNPSSIPATPLGTYEVGAGVNNIYVKNGYAYLATDSSTKELVVLNVNDLAHPALRGSYDAPGASGSGQGRSLYTVGDTLYLGRYSSLTAGAPEFAVLDTTSANPALLGSRDTGGTTAGIYGLIAGNGRAFLLSGNATTGGGQLLILDASNPSAITQTATVALPSSGAPVALDCEWNSADGKTYLYAASVPVSGGSANKGAITVISGL